MSPRNAVVALVAGIVLFLLMILGVHLAALPALAVALVGAAAAVVVANRLAAPGPLQDVSLSPALVPPEPTPPQWQTRQIGPIPLPSARLDYSFTFSATVRWLLLVDGPHSAGELADNVIISRARQITQQQDPNDVDWARSELTRVLVSSEPDLSRRVQAHAEDVKLMLSDDDRKRLAKLAELRKDTEQWEYQRNREQSQRAYLHADVLKDSSSAVVWWLAKNENDPEKVAGTIGALNDLVRAAGSTGLGPVPPPVASAEPQPSAEQFDSFLDSLGMPANDARLMLTQQMAKLLESHGYPDAARQMGSSDDWPDPDDEPSDL